MIHDEQSQVRTSGADPSAAAAGDDGDEACSALRSSLDSWDSASLASGAAGGAAAGWECGSSASSSLALAVEGRQPSLSNFARGGVRPPVADGTT